MTERTDGSGVGRDLMGAPFRYSSARERPTGRCRSAVPYPGTGDYTLADFF